MNARTQTEVDRFAHAEKVRREVYDRDAEVDIPTIEYDVRDSIGKLLGGRKKLFQQCAAGWYVMPTSPLQDLSLYCQ